LASSTTRIQLCGRLAVEIDGERLEAKLPGRQGRLLFVYLAANRHRPVGRDELIDALWPDEAPAAADAALSALLSKLRRVLGPGRLEGRSEVRLLLDDEAWIDLEAATEAVHRAESALELGDWTGAYGPARVAQHVGLRGFLPGGDAAWVDEIRRRLDDMLIRGLDCLTRACLEIGGTELATAGRSARLLVDRAPYRESGYRFLMELYVRAGNAGEAVQLYDGLRRLLRDDLGIAPAAETQELYKRLLLEV
jgi:DNA-binding SARP family transcriptional activator